MSFGDWFKRLFSPARTDTAADVANEPDYEKTRDEARLAASGGVSGVGYAAMEAESVVEGLAEEAPPSEPAP
jgi:hypothetical protein